MIKVPIPPDEQERLLALHQYNILDTEREQDFDDIVKLAAHICEIDTAHISLIDADRQWLKAIVGLGAQNVDRNLAFCSRAILQDDVLIVQDATQDERFFDNPMVVGAPKIRFYAGMPLISTSGHKIGSLCVIDVQPRKLRDEQVQALRVLSKQVIKQLELRKTLRDLNHQSQQLLELNENNNRLLSIIGHDVRGPIASMGALFDLIEDNLLSPEELTKVIGEVKKTAINAESLLNDLLQWATALQEGNAFSEETISIAEQVNTLLENHAAEFTKKSNQTITKIPDFLTVFFDKNILVFVLRNLLLNANKFTAQGTITISAEQGSKVVTINVQDSGQGISTDRVQTLFDWKKRMSTKGTMGEKGSGLALLLCNDLLSRNGAKLSVTSNEGEGSIFSISLPSPS